MLVAVNLLPFWANHDGNLRAVHHRLVRCLGAADAGTPGGTRLHYAKFVVVDGRAAATLFFQRLRLFTGVADMDNLPIAVEAAVRMFGE